jgi:alkylation response protein AidB-like acyl-CoA dehydrogenase
MDVNFSPEELEFRDEVRAFLLDNLPADMRDRVRRGDDGRVDHDIRTWQRTLHARGWGAAWWPKQFGGTGWSKAQQFLFETECALAYAPSQLPFGLKMVAPVLMRFGDSEQQQRFLPRILDGSDWWCQGYSEPGSGSDLASLDTRAVRDGASYVVNGQKSWTTLGQFADWIFCLVRTDPSAKPQRGISFLLIDMKTPGITVRPTRLLDERHEVNEIWFDNVRVPLVNRVGPENEGWTCAKYLLGYERTNLGGIGGAKRELERLVTMAASLERGGRPLLQDPQFTTRIAEVELELKALELTNLRVIFAEARREAPGPEASILKIRGTEILQRISELQVEALGARALVFDDRFDDEPEAHVPRAVHAYLTLRKLTIYGGSNEIQRNIIAQMILKI